MSGTKKARVDQGASGSHYAALSFIFGMGMTFALYYEISTWGGLAPRQGVSVQGE